MTGAEADVDLVVVTMVFDGSPAGDAQLRSVLARYVVMARQEPGCRNIDLMASATRPHRYVVVQKWASAEAQRSHLDSAVTVAMAEGTRGSLRHPPEIDLHDPISVHDLT